MSDVRGGGQEYQTATEQERPRGANRRPRSGAATRGVTPCLRSGVVMRGDSPRPKPEARGGGQEELPHAPMLEAKGSGWEEQPPVQGAVAARAQESLEELSHVEGQKGGR